MNNLTLLILLCSFFSLPSFAQEKIMVQNLYYPKPGKIDEVLALRIAASKLLKEFGMTSGRVMVSKETVVWQGEYLNISALEKELKTFTPEQQERFKKEILERMKLLVDRHERTTSTIVFE